MMKSSATVALALLYLNAGCSTPPPKGVKNEQAVQTPATVSVGFEVAPVHPPAGSIEFKAALDLHQNPSGLEPQLRHGTIAKSIDWPASLYATFSVPGGTAACTSALLGPYVMLTAAHCVPSNGHVTIHFSNGDYDTTCTQHPKYGNDASSDFGLCKLTKPFSEPPGFQYETVDTASMDAMLNQKTELTGFGCISDAVSAAQIDGKYRIGANNIDETSSSSGHRRGSDFYTPKQKNNLFTVDDPTLANLCPGDSGGPAFRLNAGAADVNSRTIVGVNSRVFYRDASHTTYGSSMISATGGPDFPTWAEAWAKDKGVGACGITGSIPNCRH
jgi:hypothetical protein